MKTQIAREDSSRILRLSVVVTAYNSERTIEKLITALVEMLSKQHDVFVEQIIVIDDASTDSTFSKALVCSRQIPQLRIVRLSRNYGQQIAMSAGIKRATGDAVLIMDDDGQNPISEIPGILNRFVVSDAEIVIATAKHSRFSRRVTSKIFWLAMRSSRIPGEPESQLMMRVFSRRVAEAFKSYPEANRTIYGVMRDIGFKSEGYKVDVDEHLEGREISRYSFLKRLEVFIDAYLSSGYRPFGSLLGHSVILALVGGITGTSLLIFGLIDRFSRILVGGLFFSGISILLGLAGFFAAILIRLIALTYVEARRRPLYHLLSDSGVPSGLRDDNA